MIHQPKVDLKERIKNQQREREYSFFFSEDNARENNKFIENKMRKKSKNKIYSNKH